MDKQIITLPTPEMYPDRYEPFAPVKQDFTVSTDADKMMEADKPEGMYEDLQIRLGKSYLEVHEIISAL